MGVGELAKDVDCCVGGGLCRSLFMIVEVAYAATRCVQVGADGSSIFHCHAVYMAQHDVVIGGRLKRVGNGKKNYANTVADRVYEVEKPRASRGAYGMKWK